MDAPPLSGATQLSTADALALTADTEVGGCGVVDGITGAVAAESGLCPLAFTAATVKV